MKIVCVYTIKLKVYKMFNLSCLISAAQIIKFFICYRYFPQNSRDIYSVLLKYQSTWHKRYVNSVMRLVFSNCFTGIKLQIHIVSFKVTTLGSHTALQTILPFLITVLELGYWNSLQLFGYGCLNILQCQKITYIEVIFQSWEQKKFTWTQVG